MQFFKPQDHPCLPVPVAPKRQKYAQNFGNFSLLLSALLFGQICSKVQKAKEMETLLLLLQSIETLKSKLQLGNLVLLFSISILIRYPGFTTPDSTSRTLPSRISTSTPAVLNYSSWDYVVGFARVLIFLGFVRSNFKDRFRFGQARESYGGAWASYGFDGV